MVARIPSYDAIVVGSGFGGCYMLNELRKKGFRTLVLDEQEDLGGIWTSNIYDGVRTDSAVPLYEFSDKNLWKDWFWSEKYPRGEELRRYFQHVDAKLQLKKDIRFNSRVLSATFSSIDDVWNIEIQDGTVFTAKHFILCTGFASKPNIPNFKGLDKFHGILSHTAKWPKQGIDFKDKDVCIVGNGSSGLQVIQEIAPVVKSMTVFQRHPTYAMPMRLRKLSKEEQKKETYEDIYALRTKMFAGIDREFNPKSAVEVSEEERQEFWEKIWAEGGLSFWLANYKDVLLNKESNRQAYDFWRSKVIPRIADPVKAELLAPENPPFFFGTKRATLEQRYYEVYNQSNVDLIDVNANPVQEIVAEGIITADGKLNKFDIIVLATGFDSVTGGILAIDIEGVDGQKLRDKWAKGTYTNLGLSTAGFPNMFFLYGPQGPTSFCNGPTCAEVQGDWIVSTIEFMRDHGHNRIDTDLEAEKQWREQVNAIGNATLLPYTESEYMGTNIPGKAKESLNFLGGLPSYISQINGARENSYQGFVLK